MDWEDNPPFGFRNQDDLFAAYTKHCDKNLQEIHLSHKLSKQRILDAFQAWREDLNRTDERSFRDSRISPGHVKAAAFLTYWLRREAPIVDIRSSEGQYSLYAQLCVEHEIDDSAGLEEVSREQLQKIPLPNGMSMLDIVDNRNRIFAYGNELLAFTFGFLLAKRYEEQRLSEKGMTAIIPMPSLDYVEDICYLFKFKSVSPHAIDLIFRSLLMVRSTI